MCTSNIYDCRSQWPCGLRRRSSAAHLLRSWVRIPPGAWMFVCCQCCVLSGGGICDGLIARPEESCRLWRLVVCDQETSKTRRLKPATGLWKIQSQSVVTPGKQTNIYDYFYQLEWLSYATNSTILHRGRATRMRLGTFFWVVRRFSLERGF